MKACEVKEVILPTGATVILSEVPDARSVSMGIFVRSGAAHELDEESGVSHFLEHLVFKGASHDGIEVTEAMANIGAHINAYTTDEHTSFYASCLPDVANEALPLLLGLLEPRFSAKDVDVERDVILEEMRQYRDDPSFVAHESALRFFAAGHPLTRSILGQEQTVKALSERTIKRFFERRYLPQRIAVVVAGAIAGLDVLEPARRTTERLPQSHTSTVEPLVELVGRVGRNELSWPATSTAHLLALWPGVSEHNIDKFALELWCDIVGAGARLGWGVVEPGLVDSAGIACELRQSSGYVMLSASGDANSIVQSETEIGALLDQLTSNPVTQDELLQSKSMTRFALDSTFETPSDVMTAHGEHWLTHGEPYPLEREQALFGAVSLAEVNRFNERFRLSNAAVTILRPD